ncbi:uncharacterized protein LOC118404064 [Branchiostoma floridae]|uniref:Uncharacterized protein LOC118404064 n=1 Tax=Branchiostoma floridae TaxID=7739 RepID=A0A9J7K6N3_BRAFL|nr:uncharacterized protein LOC118404064 [Branchiostoma floridae]
MATYSLLPTEEPEAPIAQPDKDSDKKASVNISVSCPSNNFCTRRLIYALVVIAIVCIFVFVAVYQTVLKAVLVVVAIVIIVVLSYVAYFYVSKRSNLTAQKDGKPSANGKQEEVTESTTEPVVKLRDIQSVAFREEKDDVEIIDLSVATGFQSEDAVDRTPVFITEEDSDEVQEPLTIHGHTDPKMTFITEHGAIYTVVENTKNIATHRGTKNVTVVFGGNNMFCGPVHVPWRPGGFQLPEWKPYFDVIAKEMPADWQQLATNLGLPWAQIRAVDRQHSGDCWICCQQVLDMWRSNNGAPATVEDLIQAVRDTGHKDVVEKLEAMQ